MKGLRLLLDQGLPRDDARALRTRGCDCTHVAEIGMHDAEDSAILSFAAERGLSVVTLDADFHALLAASGECHPAVIRLRLQGVNAAVAVLVIETAIARFSGELEKGSAVTVKPTKTTCHRLPIRRQPQSQLLRNYPELKPEDIRQALEYAAANLGDLTSVTPV